MAGMPYLRRGEKPVQVDDDAPQVRELGVPGVPAHLDGVGDHLLDPGDRRGHVGRPGRFVEAPGYGLDRAGEVLVDGHPDVDELNVRQGGLREECGAVGFRADRLAVFVW